MNRDDPSNRRLRLAQIGRSFAFRGRRRGRRRGSHHQQVPGQQEQTEAATQITPTIDKQHPFQDTIVIVARHGARLDHAAAKESNWCTDTDEGRNRPWDPPLSAEGEMQARKLGIQIAQEIRRLGLPPLTAVYASPLLRTQQTARGAIEGYQQQQQGDGDGYSSMICIENGLMESVNEDWYRSWALPGSDGTWGYTPQIDDSATNSPSSKRSSLDPNTLHPSAMQPASKLMARRTAESEDNDLDEGYISTVPLTHYDAFCAYNNGTESARYESSQELMDRMKQSFLACCSAARGGGGGGTILLISHGGPVAHLYRSLTDGSNWHLFGQANCCSYTIYEHCSRSPCCAAAVADCSETGNETRQRHNDDDWEAAVINESSYLTLTDCNHDRSVCCPQNQPCQSQQGLLGQIRRHHGLRSSRGALNPLLP